MWTRLSKWHLDFVVFPEDLLFKSMFRVFVVMSRGLGGGGEQCWWESTQTGHQSVPSSSRSSVGADNLRPPTACRRCSECIPVQIHFLHLCEVEIIAVPVVPIRNLKPARLSGLPEVLQRAGQSWD